jgi:hypothetical protein
VQISCPKCNAEYELDPPAAPFARDQDLVFRCTNCGASIPLRGLPEDGLASELEEPDTDVLEAPEPPKAPKFLLKQEGNSYHVRDEAMLQRWIAERRVWPDDQISIDAGPWERVGDIPEYTVFFKLVDDAERADTASTVVQTKAKPANLTVAVKPGLFAKPDALHVFDDQQDSESSEDVEVPEPPTETASRFGEVVPDEQPASLSLNPDEPTMDMELEEEDFFSEEQTALADRKMAHSQGSDDDDELFEWQQHRRRNMAMWWLMFLGALGAVAYLALDFLNKRDQAKAVVSPAPAAEDTVEVEAAKAPAEEPVDSGAVPSGEPVESTENSTPEAKEVDVPKVPDPPPAAKPEPAIPAVEKPAPKASSASPAESGTTNVAVEIRRGWNQIDRSNWAKARSHFDAVLRAQPGNSDGRFGIAYVNEKQGRVAEAVSQYCRLVATASGEAKGEAAGRLRALGKDCP